MEPGYKAMSYIASDSCLNIKWTPHHLTISAYWRDPLGVFYRAVEY